MKREILFRGKRVDDGKWVEGQFMTFNDRVYFCRWAYGPDFPELTANDFDEVHPETVGQYTGLTDKNGNKIFEGDKIRGFNNINKYSDPSLTNLEPTYTDSKFVEYLEGGFCLSSEKYPNGGCGRLQTYRPNRSEFIEIIGNIHEKK